MQNNFQTSSNPATAKSMNDTETKNATPQTEQTGDVDARYDLVLLNPASVRLFRTGGPTSALRATISDEQLGAERSYLRVQVARAFPLRNPDRYIGLRDGADKDIGMLVTLDGLDSESRRLTDEELFRRYFLPKIIKVNDVKDEFGLTTWEVETDKGSRRFVVRNLRDSAHELSATRVLLTDTDGNRWEFPDVRKLDEKSYAIIQRVL